LLDFRLGEPTVNFDSTDMPPIASGIDESDSAG
jgi:hypothetical protein